MSRRKINLTLKPNEAAVPIQENCHWVDELHAKARKGNPYAQFALAQMYVEGRYVKFSMEEAKKWHYLAVKQGLKGGRSDYA